jgi:multidrug resistance efflux pump
MENLEINDGLKIYSEEVRDVLSDPPKAILRWGNTILFGFVLILVVLSYVIKYPDIIVTQIIITTNTPPEKLVAKVSGKIKTILIKDKSIVTNNTALAVIENAANYTDVFKLSDALNVANETKSVSFDDFQNSQLGDVENAFAIYQKESIANNLNNELQPFQVDGTAQSFETIQLKERLNLLESQKSINQSELVIQKSDLDRFETLYKKGIIATQEIEKQRLIYLQSQKNYKSVLSTISSLKSSLIELNKNSKTTKINESKENINLERNKIQAFYQLKKAIKDWEMNYVLRSSVSGKVTFLQVWAENQFVNAGDNVFSIVPINKSDFIGKLKAPNLNAGKIQVGQNVNIRLANFPDREFGMLEGKIKNISLTPDKDGNLLIDVILPKGLQTSYNKKIIFQQEMSGTAEIITEDLRLIERILYQFRDVFRR